MDGSTSGDRDVSEEYKGVSSLFKQRHTRQQYFALASTLASEPKVLPPKSCACSMALKACYWSALSFSLLPPLLLIIQSPLYVASWLFCWLTWLSAP